MYPSAVMSKLSRSLRHSGGMLRPHRRSISSSSISTYAVDPLAPSALSENEMEIVQDIMGYHFRNSELLQEAFIHTSYPNRPLSSLVYTSCKCHHSMLIDTTSKYRQSYKNLKIVGERALASELYYHVKPGSYDRNRIYNILEPTANNPSEASIRAVHAANISTQKLARIGLRLGIYHFLRRNSAKLDQEVEDFQKLDFRKVVFGGTIVKAPKVLADIVLAVAGAIHEDAFWEVYEYEYKKKSEKTWEVMEKHLAPIITWEKMVESVRTLSEVCENQGMKLHYRNRRFPSSTTGYKAVKQVDINKTQIYINGKRFGSGTSEFEFIAKCSAATEALLNLPSSMLRTYGFIME